jgi:DNA-binding transcriptional LysR family regulator
MKHDVGAVGRRVDLNLLVVFEAIYHTRNSTAAGEALGLSQPAMSHALSRLRTVFRDPLFVRLPRGLQPTPFADEIAPALTESLATIRASFERSRFDPATSTRMFTIAMADIGEVAHLPHVLRGVHHEAPHVRIRTVEMSPSTFRTALADARADLALAANLTVKPPLRQALIVESGYATVARANHPEIRGKLSLEQFRKARHLLVMPQGPRQHGEIVERALRSAKVRAEIAVEVAHFHPVAAIVTQSDLIATIPRGLAFTMSETTRVQVFDPPIPLPTTRITLLWHERCHHDAGNTWLRDLYLREVGAAIARAARTSRRRV